MSRIFTTAQQARDAPTHAAAAASPATILQHNLSLVLPHLKRTKADPRPVVLMTCGLAGSGKTTVAKGVLEWFHRSRFGVVLDGEGEGDSAIDTVSISDTIPVIDTNTNTDHHHHPNPNPDFTRLSIDEFVYTSHGLYGINYPADDILLAEYQAEAEIQLMSAFHALLDERKDVLLDLSHWSRADREEMKREVEGRGGRWVLVYLEVGEGEREKEELWRRVCVRTGTGMREDGGGGGVGGEVGGSCGGVVVGERDANSAVVITREVFERYWEGFERPVGEGEIVLRFM